MAVNISNYTKKKNFLICVDSDGCAIDSMDVKHFNCFGPCMVEEWNLHKWKEEILARWNQINLYTLTRGINRFKGLAMALLEINDKYCEIEDINTLYEWSNKTKELSNEALIKAINDNPNSISLKKALSWSNAVNKSITELSIDRKPPYQYVKEALTLAHQKADVAIVSSANLAAVMEEWEHYKLIEHTDIVLAQNAGTKAICIAKLLEKGYLKENVLMCGDALGDLKAAQSNGVLFYPIIARHEATSWKEFIDVVLEKFLNGTYANEYQAQKERQFIDNLSDNK